MKYILISAAFLFFSCYSKDKSTNVKKSKSDTTKVLAVFKVGNKWNIDTSFRITKDTFKLSKIDTAQQSAKMVWQKDTVYFIPLVTDTVNKKINWYGVPPAYVQEVNVTPLK